MAYLSITQSPVSSIASQRNQEHFGMAFTSFSSMSIKSPNISTASSKSPHHVLSLSKPFRIAYQLDTERGNQLADCSKNGYQMETAKSKNWARVVSTTLAAAVISFSSCNLPAVADLNKFEAEIRGEFGIGSAAQFGSADLRKTVHLNENFRRANFTSADMRESDFSGSTFNGAYMEKAVAYKANFTGADLSDTLMDRMVLNEANLTNAVLVRTVLTRSDLGGALIVGADFSDAVIDLTQKQALCKYASGTNPITGVSTRASLGCGNSRRNAYGTPSSPLLSAPLRNCWTVMVFAIKALVFAMRNNSKQGHPTKKRPNIYVNRSVIYMSDKRCYESEQLPHSKIPELLI